MIDSTAADVPEPTPADIGRGLMRGLDRAVLSTRFAGKNTDDADGWPYGSLVIVAADQDATPILLISKLAEHTRNIEADARVSLLFDGTAGLAEPLTGPRLTVLGRARRLARGEGDEARLRARFLARHPGAAMYADFGDFGFFSVAVERAHLVAGFGRIHWIEGAALMDTAAPALTARERDVIDHMNADHADAIALYATALLGLPQRPQGAPEDAVWIATGIDPEGLDLRCGGTVARLPFDKRVEDAEAARVELVRLVKRARGLTAES